MATIGPWTSKSADIHGQVLLEADATALNAILTASNLLPSDLDHLQPDLPTLSVHTPPIARRSPVPVASMHGDSSAMDRDMRNALKALEHPAIEYVFTQLQHVALQWDPGTHQTNLKLNIVGKLNMAGTKRPITMDMIVSRDSSRHFIAHAQISLLMTDFGMTPPQALFGLIRASEQVLANIDLDFVLVNHSTGAMPSVQTAEAPPR